MQIALYPLAIALLAPVQRDADFLRAETLASALAEAAGKVEQATGKRFKKPPTAAIATRAEIRAILVSELLPQIKIQLPQSDDKQQRTQAELRASYYAQILVAKYGVKERKLFVVAENFWNLAKLLDRPRIHSAEFMRVSLIHEAVHALDEETYGCMSRLANLSSADEFEIWNALIEGHAQHVTHKILAAEGKADLFQEFERTVGATPPGLDPTQKFLAGIMAQSLSFAYLDGRVFFERLKESGPASYVDDVFKNPPKNKSVIIRPERYYDPDAAPVLVDLDPLWESIAKAYDDSWFTTKRELDESILRGAIGDFVEKERVDAALAEFEGGNALSLQPIAAPDSKFIAVSVTQLQGVAAAKRFYDLNVALMKAKDEKLKGGLIRVIETKYTTLDLEQKVRHTLKKARIEAGGQTVAAQALLVQTGKFVLEFVFNNYEPDRSQLIEQLKSACDFLSPSSKVSSIGESDDVSSHAVDQEMEATK
jgi:hypothetical protein